MPDAIKLPPGATLVTGGTPLPPGATLAGDEPQVAPVAPPTRLQKIGGGALDLAKGAGEGFLHTLSSADDWATKHLPAVMTTPIGQEATPENSAKATAYAKDLATPTNTLQKIGKGTEQAAEFLVPGGAEEQAGKTIKNVMDAAPALKRFGGAASTLLPAAAGGAFVNKLQGGSAGAGAAAGAVGAGIGAGLKKIAPTLAETALKVRAPDRAYGRTPGQMILDETTGIRPASIAKQAGAKVGQYTSELDSEAKGSPEMVDLDPTRDEVSSWYDTALKRNNDATASDVKKIGKQLDARGGQPIPRFVSPDEGLALRRGIDDLQTSWNPATTPDFSGRAVSAARNVLGNELDRTIPRYSELTGKISNLMPVEKRAEAADLNAGMVQRSLDRFKAHTGALAAPLLGAGAGYASHGLSGMLMGGAAGLALPELISSPETQMMAARAFNSPGLRRFVIPAARGAAMQVPAVFANSPR